MELFRAPRIQDRAWVQSLLDSDPVPLCDYNFSSLFCWSSAYRQDIARWKDRLLVRVVGSLGPGYLWPVGQGAVSDALAVLAQDAVSQGQPPRFYCLTGPMIQELEALCPSRFYVEPARNAFDYVYGVEQLADLPGKKLHAKRNHIHRFEERYPDWTFARLTPDLLPECREMEEQWFRQALERQDEAESRTLPMERSALSLALEHFSALGLDGGLIRAGGEVIAFTMGTRLTSAVFDVQYERARAEIQGAYAIINREFARLIRDTYPAVQWVDREDDMGQPGLRKAKLSYSPARLEEKFTAVCPSAALNPFINKIL